MLGSAIASGQVGLQAMLPVLMELCCLVRWDASCASKLGRAAAWACNYRPLAMLCCLTLSLSGLPGQAGLVYPIDGWDAQQLDGAVSCIVLLNEL